RLKTLLLLVNTSPAAPPPRLMHKRPVRGIHQPNDAVVDVARQIGGEMRSAKSGRELWHLRNSRQFSVDTARTRLRDKDPGIPVALLAGIRPGEDLRRIQRILAGQRGNLHALAAAGLKLPAMILAGHALAVEPSGRERNAAMRAQIAHGEDFSVFAAAQQQRYSQQQRRAPLAAAQIVDARCRVPVAVDQLRSRAGCRIRCRVRASYGIVHSDPIYSPEKASPSQWLVSSKFPGVPHPRRC